MIGEAVRGSVPQVINNKPPEGWYRLLVRTVTELAETLTAGKHKKLVLAPSDTQTIVAGSRITTNAAALRLSAAGAVTMTSAPTIEDGEDGQLICLTNVGSNNITIQDQGTLASSNLRLSGATVVITPRDSLWLRYDSVIGDWVQVTTLVGVV